tara:strand:+ start:786 stop:1169 length:384 start_codon:yes stop_codon:yes gene_type:complete
MNLSNIADISQKKYWAFDPSKKYHFYFGKKVYLSTKWDTSDKINLKHYGTLIDINDLCVAVNAGYHPGYIQLPRIIYFTHDEINFLFLKKHDYVSIRSSYKNIKNINSIDEQTEKHKLLVNNNFRTI